MSFIVAVDGPAGSGKGTITKRIEKEMGLINLDTGATYRCVALETIRHGLKAENEKEIIELLNNMQIKIEKQDGKDVIYLNGEDVSKKIREMPVSKMVSQISAIIPVREKLVEIQREMVKGKNVIAEGRDIGTVVFPNANLKIYLDANEEVRAKRRYNECVEKGMKTTYQEVLENIITRDTNDKNKKYGALKKADDAILIDTSNMSIDEVVEKVKKEIKAKM